MDEFEPDEPAGLSRLERLRRRYAWLDHLVRAGQRYTTNHGDHYAAAITYFSVLALVPLLMIGFAVAGFVLVGQPELVDEIKEGIAEAAPGELGDTLNDVVDQAIASRAAVGVIGLLGAAYSGLGWMNQLRLALTAQWEQNGRIGKPSFLKAKATDALALVGLGLAIVVSFAITAAGSAFATDLLELVGLDGYRWARALVVLLALALGLLGNWLVFVLVLTRVPRVRVPVRLAVRPALLAAVGFELLKQLGAIYLASLGGSPAGLAFGPLLGLLVFVFLVSRFLLFVTAWAATDRGASALVADLEPPAGTPPAAVIRPTVVVRDTPDGRTVAGLVGAGAVLGIGLSRLLRRR